MPRFSYRAKNLKGEEENGILESESIAELARTLRQKGYFLVSTQESGRGIEGRKKGFTISQLNIFEKFIGVSLADKLFFTRNLEIMIRTGVSLPRAFEILAAQVRNRRFKKALGAISEKIIKGQTLSESLGDFPDIFSSLYRETLKVGEETGKLEDTLKILTKQIEREYSLRSKVKTAMVYPLMVSAMAFLIGALMMVFAVPKLKEAFEQLNVELPFTTKLILSFAGFLTEKWLLSFFIGGGMIFLFFFALRTERGKMIKDKILLKTPIISKITKQTNSALCLRILSSLLKAGVPIVQSLRVTSGALGNFYFRKSLEESAKVVEKGKRISQALAPYENLYSNMVLQMMEIGEETGETSEVLEKLADFYEEEVANATEKLSSIVEPVMILIIGGAVGFFAVSMMQPMFSVMGGIK